MPDAPLREAAIALLGPDGPLAATEVEAAAFEFENRAEQLEMATRAADALEEGTHLIVEAGTGVGKSLAYLVPLLLHAKRNNSRVAVSTHTISLQEQLMDKDLPLLAARLPVKFRAVLVKGRSNYLCLRRLATTHSIQRELFTGDREQELQRLRAWADKTEDGSVQELRRPPAPEIWASICAEHGNCMGRKCKYRQRCFLQRARARMDEADVLVANHHVIFSDLALRRAGGGFLPPVSALVLDEAHTVEDTASDHLGLRLSMYMFEHWLRRLLSPDSGKGLLGILKAGEAAQTTARLWDAVAVFFHELPNALGLLSHESQHVVAAPPVMNTALPGLLRQLAGQLDAVLDTLPDGDEEMRMELRSLRQQSLTLCAELEAFLGQTLEDHVYWVERQGKRRQWVMYSAPIEVAPVLNELLFSREEPVILTSATLAVGNQLDYFRDRLGVGAECRLACLGSPFDHARQMRLWVAANAPDPKDETAFAEAVAKGVLRWTLKTDGGAFALFTSDKLLKQTAQAIKEPLKEADITLLAQGHDLTRRAMLEAFKEDDGRFVLFGLDSFWMGVDVRGDALRNVIVTRLPFSVPDHPVTAARLNRIKEKGGNPFRDYSLPEAVLKFRQGVGRLLRSRTDEGIVVVLDSRLLTKWYGRLFLKSLPECPVETFEL